jgi:hypothetical protein
VSCYNFDMSNNTISLTKILFHEDVEFWIQIWRFFFFQGIVNYGPTSGKVKSGIMKLMINEKHIV